MVRERAISMSFAIVGRRRAGLPSLRHIPAAYFGQRANQAIDLLIGMQRRRGEAQALGASRHGGVVDRLDIDAKPQKQLVGYGLATLGVAH